MHKRLSQKYWWQIKYILKPVFPLFEFISVAKILWSSLCMLTHAYNTFLIFITFFWKYILGLLSLDIFELVRVQSLKHSMKLTGSQFKLSRNIPSLMRFWSNPSMPGHKLVRGAHTVRILDSIEYFLGSRPITLSWWILTLAITRVYSTSAWSSCSFPVW